MNGLIGKIEITGKLTLLTGMHIGAGNVFSMIGSIDEYTVRDAVSKVPYIPGSSLKGKLRYLLARHYANDEKLVDINEENYEIKRLFGSNDGILSRLQFYDLSMSEESLEFLSKKDTGLSFTEIKFENTINRKNGVAMPRQIERVPRGSAFDLKIIYNVENLEEIEKDLQNIKTMFELLELDYLGGHGSRGYGRVKISDLKTKAVFNEEELAKYNREL